MAMNAANLANEMKAALDAALPDYSSIDNDHRLSGFDKNSYDAAYLLALATAIINHITTNAKAIGTDTPTGDTHNLSIV